MKSFVSFYKKIVIVITLNLYINLEETWYLNNDMDISYGISL